MTEKWVTESIYVDVDTGEIIHQGRPKIYLHDSFQQLSCRFLKHSFKEYINIAINFDKIEKPIASSNKKCMTRKIYKKADFTEESCKKLYSKFSKGLLCNYLKNKIELDQSVPILIQNNSF